MTYLCGSGFFFFNDTATTEIYTLSLHDALPIYGHQPGGDEDDVPPGAQLGGLAELEPVVVLVEHRRHRAPQQTEVGGAGCVGQCRHGLLDVDRVARVDDGQVRAEIGRASCRERV